MANTQFGPYEIAVNESNASRRMVYFSLYSASRETMPVTLGQNIQPALHLGGRAAISTSSTVRAADATNGLYYLVLSQSETSVVGQAIIRMSNTSIPETTVTIQFKAVDSGDSMRFGMFSQPNAAAGASGGLPLIGSDYGSTFTVGVSNLNAAMQRSIASSWMSTNLGQNRYAQEALFALRNRVFISGSTMTVYHPDDTTSSWTASVTTGTVTITGCDPGGL